MGVNLQQELMSALYPAAPLLSNSEQQAPRQGGAMDATLQLLRLVRYLDEDGNNRYELAFGGSFDDAPGPDQMRAIHHGLGAYFGTEDWLTARKQEMPGF